jgi:hypothetical protein
MVSFTIRPLYPRYPLDRRLGELQSQSRRYGEDKVLAPTGTQTPILRASRQYTPLHFTGSSLFSWTYEMHSATFKLNLLLCPVQRVFLTVLETFSAAVHFSSQPCNSQSVPLLLGSCKRLGFSSFPFSPFSLSLFERYHLRALKHRAIITEIRSTLDVAKSCVWW